MLVHDHLPIVQPELQPGGVNLAAHSEEPGLAIGEVLSVDEEASVGSAPVGAVDVEVGKSSRLRIRDHLVGGVLRDLRVQKGSHLLGRPARPDAVDRRVRQTILDLDLLDDVQQALRRACYDGDFRPVQPDSPVRVGDEHGQLAVFGTHVPPGAQEDHAGDGFTGHRRLQRGDIGMRLDIQRDQSRGIVLVPAVGEGVAGRLRDVERHTHEIDFSDGVVVEGSQLQRQIVRKGPCVDLRPDSRVPEGHVQEPAGPFHGRGADPLPVFFDGHERDRTGGRLVVPARLPVLKRLVESVRADGIGETVRLQDDAVAFRAHAGRRRDRAGEHGGGQEEAEDDSSSCDHAFAPSASFPISRVTPKPSEEESLEHNLLRAAPRSVQLLM